MEQDGVWRRKGRSNASNKEPRAAKDRRSDTCRGRRNDRDDHVRGEACELTCESIDVPIGRPMHEQATEEDVVQFFEGFELEHVRICTNASGRVTGDAYVRFASAAEAQEALSKRHRQMMGKRYIELFTAHDVERGDVPTAPSPVGTPVRAQGGVVRLRGLPYVAMDSDVRAFLSGLDVLPNGVHLTKHADGRPTGEAFVEFASEESVNAALGRNKERMGTRYIEVFRATKEDLRMVMQRGNGALNDKIVGNGAPMEGDGCWLKLRGLPYSAVEGDIEQFFKGFSLVPNGIHLTKKGDRPKGEAYVEMVSPEEAERARTSLHKSMLGSRYIEIFRSNRGDGARGKVAAWPAAVQPGYPAPIQQPPVAYSAAAMSPGGGMPQVQMAAMQQQSIQYLPTQHAHALGMDPLAWQAGLGIADYGNGLQLQHSHTWANVGSTYASHLGTPMQNWAQQ